MPSPGPLCEWKLQEDKLVLRTIYYSVSTRMADQKSLIQPSHMQEDSGPRWIGYSFPTEWGKLDSGQLTQADESLA